MYASFQEVQQVHLQTDFHKATQQKNQYCLSIFFLYKV